MGLVDASAFGDEEPGGDVAQVEVLLAQVQGVRQRGLVGDGGAADGFAAGAGGLAVFSRTCPQSQSSWL
ncbi:hypothetical protein [Actinomadura sediminis]|uniref:Uncharacterized protein n=1 Tax=Actinomadura sediminis TaxID=1038904 RepID=A0ABW3ELR3_9ACTN